MSSYRIRYLLAAPVIVVLGLSAAFWGRRAAAFGNNVRHWADSLDRGSGPMRVSVALPIYISGTRVGNLDTVVIQRHAAHSIDSVRVVVKSLSSANVAELTSCAVRVQSFDPGDYKRTLTCASDTSGLTRFGTISFGAGHETSLYVDASEAACLAPRYEPDDEQVAVNVKAEPVTVDVKSGPVAVHVKTAPVTVSVNRHSSCRARVALSSGEIQQMVRDAQRDGRLSRQREEQIRAEVRAQVEEATAAARAAGRRH